VNAATARRAFIGVAALLAVIYSAFGLMVLAGGGGEDTDNAWGLAGLAAAALIAAGLWIERRSPLRGTILVAVGAIPLAVLTFWSVLTPVLAGLIIIFWLIWNRGVAKEQSSES